MAVMNIIDPSIPRFFFGLSYFWRGVLVFCTVLYITIVTLVTIAGAGYEYIPHTDTRFNQTIARWYDVFVPNKISSYAPDTWRCDPSVINVYDGFPISAFLINRRCHQFNRTFHVLVRIF
jgi:hypothetical protein